MSTAGGPDGPAQAAGPHHRLGEGEQPLSTEHGGEHAGVVLLRVGQLPPAFHRRKVHPVCRQLEPLLEHGRDEIEVPGGQHRPNPLPKQGR